MRAIHFFVDPSNANVAGTGTAIERQEPLDRWSNLLSSAISDVMKIASNGSILTIVLLSLIINQSIDTMQANKSADEMAALSKSSEIALASIAEQKKPDSPQKTARLKFLNKKLSEEVQRLRREFD